MGYRSERRRILGAYQFDCRLCSRFVRMHAISCHHTITTLRCFKTVTLLRCTVNLRCIEAKYTRYVSYPTQCFPWVFDDLSSVPFRNAKLLWRNTVGLYNLTSLKNCCWWRSNWGDHGSSDKQNNRFLRAVSSLETSRCGVKPSCWIGPAAFCVLSYNSDPKALAGIAWPVAFQQLSLSQNKVISGTRKYQLLAIMSPSFELSVWWTAKNCRRWTVIGKFVDQRNVYT